MWTAFARVHVYLLLFISRTARAILLKFCMYLDKDQES